MNSRKLSFKYSAAVLVLSLAIVLSACSLFGDESPAPVRLPEYDPDRSDEQSSELPDECLAGNWTVATVDLYLFVAELVPVPGLYVSSGSLYADFAVDGNYVYASDGFTIRSDLGPGRYIEGTGAFRSSGTYSTEPGSLVLTDSGSLKTILVWKAVKNGQVIEVPGAGPEFSLIPDGPTPYECSPEELVLWWRGPSGAIPMIFKRMTMTP